MFSSSSISDPLSCGSGFYSPELTESSPVSDGSSNNRANFFDEAIPLAFSSHPKKLAGRKKFRETRHPVYWGVRQRNSVKWVCEVREPNKKSRIWLGTFPTAEMAARAHDVAALALRGRSACLNFADSAWRLPVPASTNAKDIQKAAAAAAEGFRPVECDGVCGGNARAEEKMELPEQVFFMDEEAVFDMPGLLANMAEGLMLPPPPPPHSDVGNWVDEADVELGADVSLWSYSV